jgi:hypothetical protein
MPTTVLILFLEKFRGAFNVASRRQTTFCVIGESLTVDRKASKRKEKRRKEKKRKEKKRKEKKRKEKKREASKRKEKRQ